LARRWRSPEPAYIEFYASCHPSTLAKERDPKKSLLV
jgi:hypothetical protein